MSRSALERMKQRKLFQWALAYATAGWVVLQVLDLVGERFGWPDVLLRMLIVIISAGFLTTLVLAWYHGDRGGQRVSGAEVLLLALVLGLAGLGIGLVRRNAGNGAATERIVSVRAERGSIAVLPFVNMAGLPDQEYFSDGMTEELIAALSRVEGLKVAARTSAFQFKGRAADIREVGELLGVATVLEGSVRRAGDRLRVRAQLIDGADGYHLWSETYEQRLGDVFAVQDEISREIVVVLSERLSAPLQSPATTGSTQNVEAFELYLRGRYFANMRSEEGLDRANELFQRAIDTDPTYARAYAGLADSWIGPSRSLTSERFRRGEAAALKALELDSTLAEAHTSLGWIRMWQDRDWAAAERHFERAITSEPGHVWAHQWYAAYLLAVGRLDDGIASIGRAHRLDPLSLTTGTHVGTHYLLARRYEEAIPAYLEVLELDPEFQQARSGLAAHTSLWAATRKGSRNCAEVRIMPGCSSPRSSRTRLRSQASRSRREDCSANCCKARRRASCRR